MKFKCSSLSILTSFPLFHSQEGLNSVLFIVQFILFNFSTDLTDFNWDDSFDVYYLRIGWYDMVQHDAVTAEICKETIDSPKM